MKFAFCLFRYFPFGGLQRDFLRIAEACHRRGHQIEVYTMQWEGEYHPHFNIHVIQPAGLQNHSRAADFAKKVKLRLAASPCDVVIGFNKMPGLDWYYAADVCYQARIRSERHLFYRLLPRYWQWLSLEKSVFMRGKPTKMLMISKQQEAQFRLFYQTETERFHLLPPGISKDRLAPENAVAIRTHQRRKYAIQPEDFLLLMVGSGFKTKGLDRILRSLAALPVALKNKCRLYVLGQDNPAPFFKLARELKLLNRLYFLGGRGDVLNFLLAADVLLHPAYHENTGTVLLEALAAGLPVLTTENCGYAHYIREAKAGVVLPEPFNQAALNQSLRDMLLSDQRSLWRQNALHFAKQADIYSMPEKAVDLIEGMGQH